MRTITLDPELRSKLNGLNQQVEIRDESGRTLGHYLPEDIYREMLRAWAKSQFADGPERNAALQEVRSSGGLTTAEAVAYLEGVARGARHGS
jgi:hypothetical protein